MRKVSTIYGFRAFFITAVTMVTFVPAPGVPAQAASLEEAYSATRTRDFETAFGIFLIEARAGNVEAQYRVAGMYKAGQGTSRDEEKALYWYRQAAAQGHRKAGQKLTVLRQDTSAASGTAGKSGTELLRAARAGDVDEIGKLAAAGVGINFQDNAGVTALMEAARQGHDKALRALLESGADAELRNKDGDTALLIAAAMGNLKAVKTLVKNGADINSRDRQKATPLILAALRDDLEMASYLLSHGADIYAVNSRGRSAYDIALGRKNDLIVHRIQVAGGEKFEDLLSRRNNETERIKLDARTGKNGNRDWSPAMYAAWRGDKTATRAALNGTADLNLRDRAGLTALSLAAQGGHLDIIYMLLDAGADLSCTGDIETHPFFIAVKQGHRDIVSRLAPALKDSPSCGVLLEKSLAYSLVNGQTEIADGLIKAGVTVNDDSAFQPLIMMAGRADGELVRRLVSSGGDVNARSEAGVTALMIAAEAGNMEAVRAIVDLGGDVDLSDNLGRTALHHAAVGGDADVVKFLAEISSNIQRLTNEGNTALMLGSGKGHVPVVLYLARYKNLDQKNNVGDTALLMAVRSGFYEVSEILLKQGANPRLKNGRRENARSVIAAGNKELAALVEQYESSRSWLSDVFK